MIHIVNKNQKSTHGFSAIDMLVAIAIVALFSAMVVSNYRNFRQTSNLKSESEKLSSLMRQAQIWALTGQTFEGVRPAGGWGVHTSQCVSGTCGFFIFADVFPAEAPNYMFDPGKDRKISEVSVDSFVSINSISPASSSAIDITFTFPNAETYLNGQQVDSTAVIELLQTNTNETQSVTLNRITNRIDLSGVSVVLLSSFLCNDGIDNDGDGFCDTPTGVCTDGSTPGDPGCVGQTDNDEADIFTPPPPPGPTIEFSDTFTEGIDTELSLHSPETGAGWTQIVAVIDNSNQIPVVGSTLRADNSGYMRVDSCGGNDGSLYRINNVLSSADYEVATLYTNEDTSDDYSILFARAVNADNMYAFQWSADRGQLFVKNTGVWTQIGSNTPGISEGSRVALQAVGNRIAVRDDGVIIINEVDSTISSIGYAGVGMGAAITTGADCSSQRLDDFEVTTNIASPPPQCSDGLDNDNDGLTDASDPQCTTPTPSEDESEAS